MQNFFYSKAVLFLFVFLLCLLISCGSPTNSNVGASLSNPITIYESDTSYTPATIPNRANSTIECENTHVSNLSWGVSCTNYVALLAFDADNGVQNLAANFNVPTAGTVSTPDAVEVAEDYADLIDDRDVVMVGDGFGIVTAWSGFGDGGSVSSNCSNYTSTSNSVTMNAAQLNFTGSWSTTGLPCDSSATLPLLCMCW